MNAPTPDRWARLWQQVNAGADPEPIYRELVSFYSQTHRHYHDLSHLAECLAEFDAARHLARELVAVELAIWFHDAIYDPRAQDNEERSAELATRRISEAGGSAGLCKAVAALVLATKKHDPSQHSDAPLLVDVDLSILGQGIERFQEYEAQIRREYDWVPEPVFAARRAEILSRFMARERIYTTDQFYARYEEQARRNLQASIKVLSAHWR